jgi:hypothetical protein
VTFVERVPTKRPGSSERQRAEEEERHKESLTKK